MANWCPLKLRRVLVFAKFDILAIYIYNLVQYILDCLYQNGVFNKQNFQLVADIFSGTHN